VATKAVVVEVAVADAVEVAAVVVHSLARTIDPSPLRSTQYHAQTFFHPHIRLIQHSIPSMNLPRIFPPQPLHLRRSPPDGVLAPHLHPHTSLTHQPALLVALLPPYVYPHLPSHAPPSSSPRALGLLSSR
jgi:hypothetical protein